MLTTLTFAPALSINTSAAQLITASTNYYMINSKNVKSGILYRTGDRYENGAGVIAWVSSHSNGTDYQLDTGDSGKQPDPNYINMGSNHWANYAITDDIYSWQPTAKKGVTGVLKEIATSRGSILIHCSSGRDRTGVTIGVLSLIAGSTIQDAEANFNQAQNNAASYGAGTPVPQSSFDSAIGKITAEGKSNFLTDSEAFFGLSADQITAIRRHLLYGITSANITYNANGGRGAPAKATTSYVGKAILSSTKPTKSGYTFKNWNTKADGSGTSYSAAQAVTLNADTTLYAQFTPLEATIPSSSSSSSAVSSSSSANISSSSSSAVSSSSSATTSSFSSSAVSSSSSATISSSSSSVVSSSSSATTSSFSSSAVSSSSSATISSSSSSAVSSSSSATISSSSSSAVSSSSSATTSSSSAAKLAQTGDLSDSTQVRAGGGFLIAAGLLTLIKVRRW
ncbi:MAG: InlB B-repeat-containing protein [Streptococcaceae bacterium]|nr:InlB B-repeat-containing protein [Streptococcaceae bacterium]